jgi:hypothetical protein
MRTCRDIFALREKDWVGFGSSRRTGRNVRGTRSWCRRLGDRSRWVHVRRRSGVANEVHSCLSDGTVTNDNTCRAKISARHQDRKKGDTNT